MNSKVLLITPPFTQLNTPYPATMYIKGFLNTIGVESLQLDLGLDVMLELLSKQSLIKLFQQVEESDIEVSENCYRILQLKDEYLNTVNSVIRFLQGKNSTLAYAIIEGKVLPQASRFKNVGDVDEVFGEISIQDKAKHLATLYLQDLSDFIRETIDPFFGFNKYAERLGHSATSFDELSDQLQEAPTIIDSILIKQLDQAIKKFEPTLVLVSVPFPGNLYAAFRSAQFIKRKYPEIKISLGGGFPNTELRSIKEKRVFDYFDFITLDDGERPIQCLLEHLEGKREIDTLKRTFCLLDGRVAYINAAKEPDVPFHQTGTPDYTDIDTSRYLSILEVLNPMHRLWSDGRWNKLTMAHGCYWKKCSFCDISLDYIGIYEPVTAKLICDRMQDQIDNTGETGFHFVDEAAPPALMKEVAIEILKRKMIITWWANIRFEASFTSDLCKLLSESGCVAVSGGLEVASNRLLEMMKKGVSVEQVAAVCQNFSEAGILVHAYLMYGFPTETDQETIDSLELVRQLFETGVIQSGFWHQFAMTAHSPVGLNPEKFGVIRTGPEQGDFANNDLSHDDPEGADHEQYSTGLSTSIYNFMNGVGFDLPLQDWFDFDVANTSIAPFYIQEVLEDEIYRESINNKKKVVAVFGGMDVQPLEDGNVFFSIEHHAETIEFQVRQELADFMTEVFNLAHVKTVTKFPSVGELEELYKSIVISTDKPFYELSVWGFLKAKVLFIV